MAGLLRRLIPWALIFFIFGWPSAASTGGLFLIPTTDLAPLHGYSLEAQVDGVCRGWNADVCFFNTEYGFTDRFEAGIDFDPTGDSSPDAVLNAKLLLFQSDDKGWALAAGFFSPSTRCLDPDPFLVSTVEVVTGTRLHCGLMRTGGKGRFMVGLDHAFGERATLMADYTRGLDNGASLGIQYQFSPAFAVMAGLVRPNDGGPTGYSIHLVLSFGG